MMHRKKIALALCCVCAVLATTQAFATTWIIDPAGTYTNIQAAYSDPVFASGDTILLTAGYTYTGDGLNVNLTFSTDLIIGRTGVGADPIIDMENINGQRFCIIDTGYTVTMSNVIIQNGSSDEGGAIQNFGILYCLNCIFSNNSATVYGGAIASYSYVTGSGILNATDCIFSNNSATDYGGAIASYGYATGSGILNATDCIFSNNSATDYGGAIDTNGYATGSGILNATDCTFNNNSTTNGGAIYNYGEEADSGILYATNCTFSNNNATDYGGAIDNDGYATGSGILNATDCTFSNNSATEGGAIYHYGKEADSGILHATNCIFSNNNADNGGAIQSYSLAMGSGILNANSCIFSSNSAIYGGAIQNYSGGEGSGMLNANSCIFSSNSATYGGAIQNYSWEAGSGILHANGCIFNGNAAVFGGVLYNGLIADTTLLPGTSIFECCRFVDNSATTSAGVIYNSLGTVTAQNCWWATNGPEAIADELFYGAVDYEPWIQMSLNVGPLALGQSTLGQADLTVTFSPSCIPDGTPVTFSITSGTIVPEEGTTLNGTVTAQASGFAGTQIVCATAEPNSLTPVQLCATIQEDGQPLAPANVIGRQQMHRSPRCADLVNVITWQAAEGGTPAAAYYEIFAAPNLDTPIATISVSAPLRFVQHQRESQIIYVYYLYAVTAEGVRSEPVKVIVP